MDRTCLVSLFHPGNLLAALAAVEWYGRMNGDDEPPTVVTIIHCPGLSRDHLDRLNAIIEPIVVQRGWERPLCLDDQTLKGIVKNNQPFIPYGLILKKFREYIGFRAVDEFYFAHDLLGRIPELAMNAYPGARRITFGDALGSIYNKEYHLTLARGKKWIGSEHPGTSSRREHAFSTIVRTVAGHLTPREYHAQVAVLILPMDQTGDCLRDKELIIVPRSFVISLLSDIGGQETEINRFCHESILKHPKPHYLLLLEGISDGNFTSPENETKMYSEMVERHVPEGATVFIKPHPLSVNPVGELLLPLLEDRYNPVCVPNKMSHYPVELWYELIQSSTVLSMSYPTISLAYLYGKNVIYGLNSELIKKYIYEQFRESYKNADTLYRGQLHNLSTWDGKSVLWKGTYQ